MRVLHRVRLFYSAFLGRDIQRRRFAQMQIARQLAKRSGMPMYHRNLVWPGDDEYLAVWCGFKETTGVIRDKDYQLFQLARMVRDLPGDTVECGVFRGKGSYLICAANRGKLDYEHHAFDSFEGLSEPVEQDRGYVVRPDLMMVEGVERVHRYQASDLSVGLDLVKKNLEPFHFVRYYKGWIPERFDEVADRRFAFVHIDVDLYQPTRDSLAFFYERVVPGGVILCDDYGWVDTPGAKKACDEFFEDKPEGVAHLTTAQGLVIKH